MRARRWSARAVVGSPRSPLGNRTLYQAKDGNRVMYFAFGRPDTVVMGASEAFVTEALGTGKKITDNPDFAKWLGLVDQKAPIWAVGRVDDRVRQGLVKVMNGAVSAGPQCDGRVDRSDHRREARARRHHGEPGGCQGTGIVREDPARGARDGSAGQGPRARSSISVEDHVGCEPGSVHGDARYGPTSIS